MDAVLMEYSFKKSDRFVKILTERGFAVHVKHGMKKRTYRNLFIYCQDANNGLQLRLQADEDAGKNNKRTKQG